MSRELSDIERALQDGRAAAGWMRERSTHWSSREAADHYLQSIKDGLKACEQLRQHLKDGRKHIDVPDEAYERGPVAANLEKADEGCRLCDTCEGAGVTMIPTCEAGYHVEKDVSCPDCNGEGQVEEPVRDLLAAAQHEDAYGAGHLDGVA
jgi:hypothetical protein